MVGTHSGEGDDALPVNFFDIGEPRNWRGIKKNFEVYRARPFGSTQQQAIGGSGIF